MTPLADLDALKARIPGGIDQADEPRAEAALEDASAAVRHAASRTWLDEAGDLDNPPPIAVAHTLAAARRLFLNPNGYRSEQIGEYAWQGHSGLLTPEERDDLAGLGGDLLSVELQLPYRVNAPTSEALRDIAIEGSGWHVPVTSKHEDP
jgi:hypothetical protein